MEELWIPRAWLDGVRFRQDVRLTPARHRQPGEQPVVELHTPGRGLGEHQERQRLRRARQQIDGVAYRQCRRRDHVLQRPARRRDVLPGTEVARTPKAVTDRLEEV